MSKPRFWVDAYVANGSPDRCWRVKAAIESTYPDAAVDVNGGAKVKRNSAEAFKRPGTSDEDVAIEARVVAIIGATD